MDIFILFTFVGGLAFFLYGITTMSQGLENVAGGKLEQLLKKVTSNPLKSFALGAGITGLIQSSSAVTAMLIGLVNSGIMQLSQTVSIVIGAKLGTTITAWLLSLASLKDAGGAFILKLLNPETFSPLLAFIGICFILKSKKKKRKNIGLILMGFAILMFGMTTMTAGVAPLADDPEFNNILIKFKNPILGFICGVIVTSLIQSSSASIGILQALTLTTNISWEIAVPIVLGQNLGACISPMLASIGANVNAKRVAGIYLIYTILSVLICFPIFIVLNSVLNLEFFQSDISAVGIAIFHTGFNVIAAFILFPFCKYIENLSIKYIRTKDDKKGEKTVFLDRRLLLTPTFAASECFRKTLEMGQMVESNLNEASNLIFHYDDKKEEKISQNETKIDLYEDKLNSFLVKLSAKGLTDETSNKVSQLLLSISDFERIGDHAINILNIAKKMHELDIKFSTDATKEIKTLIEAITEIFLLSFTSYTNNDLNIAKKVDPLEDAIKNGIHIAKDNHVQRLKNATCKIEISFLYSDLLNELLRIAGHAGNIALSVIHLYSKKFFKHEYNHRDKESDSEFSTRLEKYQSKYEIYNF